MIHKEVSGKLKLLGKHFENQEGKKMSGIQCSDLN